MPQMARIACYLFAFASEWPYGWLLGVATGSGSVNVGGVVGVILLVPLNPVDSFSSGPAVESGLVRVDSLIFISSANTLGTRFIPIAFWHDGNKS